MPVTPTPPQAATHPDAPHPTPAGKSPAEQTGWKRILVVDDKASDTQLVKQYLEQTNRYVVREENDAKRALAAAEEFRPQLILLDIRMPGMDGGELAAHFKSSPRLAGVPIVFLTALVTKKELAGTEEQVGRIPMLAKPVILADLLACVKQQLGG